MTKYFCHYISIYLHHLCMLVYFFASLNMLVYFSASLNMLAYLFSSRNLLAYFSEPPYFSFYFLVSFHFSAGNEELFPEANFLRKKLRGSPRYSSRLYERRRARPRYARRAVLFLHFSPKLAKFNLV